MDNVDAMRTTRVMGAADEGALDQAMMALREGEVVVFPTDTVYGVGCDLWNPRAIERLYWAKQRPKHLAIPVLVASPGDVAQVASNLPPGFDQVVERFWPGGLTLIVPRNSSVPDILCAGGLTVAVRMPNHPIARQLIALAGGALAATSANLSSRPSPVTAQEAIDDLIGRVALVLDGGPCPGGVASAIVDLMTDPPILLRSGSLDEALRQVLPSLIVRT